jgi:rare lipoprotein A
MRTKESFPVSPGPLLGLFLFSANIRRLGQILVPTLAAAGPVSLGGCALLGPQQFAGTNSKEHFPSSVYGPASPRVVADGEPVPRGGGVYIVGEPYTIAGRTYYPSQKRYAKTGLASWYGDAFHGRRTANGEVYDKDGVSAAHPTLPLPCYARITNLHNHYSMIVRVNDRGPFAANRIVDVSRKVAETLDFHRKGSTKVRVDYIGTASLDGSDDQTLLATLRFDGPAMLEEPPATDQKRSEVAEDKPAIVARTDITPSNGQTDQSSSQPISPPSAYFKGRPVPLPPARPLTLATNKGGATKLALRRTSF